MANSTQVHQAINELFDSEQGEITYQHFKNALKLYKNHASIWERWIKYGLALFIPRLIFLPFTLLATLWGDGLFERSFWVYGKTYSIDNLEQVLNKAIRNKNLESPVTPGDLLAIAKRIDAIMIRQETYFYKHKCYRHTIEHHKTKTSHSVLDYLHEATCNTLDAKIKKQKIHLNERINLFFKDFYPEGVQPDKQLNPFHKDNEPFDLLAWSQTITTLVGKKPYSRKNSFSSRTLGNKRLLNSASLLIQEQIKEVEQIVKTKKLEAEKSTETYKKLLTWFFPNRPFDPDTKENIYEWNDIISCANRAYKSIDASPPFMEGGWGSVEKSSLVFLRETASDLIEHAKTRSKEKVLNWKSLENQVAFIFPGLSTTSKENFNLTTQIQEDEITIQPLDWTKSIDEARKMARSNPIDGIRNTFLTKEIEKVEEFLSSKKPLEKKMQWLFPENAKDLIPMFEDPKKTNPLQWAGIVDQARLKYQNTALNKGADNLLEKQVKEVTTFLSSDKPLEVKIQWLFPDDAKKLSPIFEGLKKTDLKAWMEEIDKARQKYQDTVLKESANRLLDQQVEMVKATLLTKNSIACLLLDPTQCDTIDQHLQKDPLKWTKAFSSTRALYKDTCLEAFVNHFFESQKEKIEAILSKKINEKKIVYLFPELKEQAQLNMQLKRPDVEGDTDIHGKMATWRNNLNSACKKYEDTILKAIAEKTILDYTQEQFPKSKLQEKTTWLFPEEEFTSIHQHENANSALEWIKTMMKASEVYSTTVLRTLANDVLDQQQEKYIKYIKEKKKTLQEKITFLFSEKKFISIHQHENANGMLKWTETMMKAREAYSTTVLRTLANYVLDQQQKKYIKYIEEQCSKKKTLQEKITWLFPEKAFTSIHPPVNASGILESIEAMMKARDVYSATTLGTLANDVLKKYFAQQFETWDKAALSQAICAASDGVFDENFHTKTSGLRNEAPNKKELKSLLIAILNLLRHKEGMQNLLPNKMMGAYEEYFRVSGDNSAPIIAMTQSFSKNPEDHKAAKLYLLKHHFKNRGRPFMAIDDMPGYLVYKDDTPQSQETTLGQIISYSGNQSNSEKDKAFYASGGYAAVIIPSLHYKLNKRKKEAAADPPAAKQPKLDYMHWAHGTSSDNAKGIMKEGTAEGKNNAYDPGEEKFYAAREGDHNRDNNAGYKKISPQDAAKETVAFYAGRKSKPHRERAYIFGSAQGPEWTNKHQQHKSTPGSIHLITYQEIIERNGSKLANHAPYLSGSSEIFRPKQLALPSTTIKYTPFNAAQMIQSATRGHLIRKQANTAARIIQNAVRKHLSWKQVKTMVTANAGADAAPPTHKVALGLSGGHFGNNIATILAKPNRAWTLPKALLFDAQKVMLEARKQHEEAGKQHKLDQHQGIIVHNSNLWLDGVEVQPAPASQGF